MTVSPPARRPLAAAVAVTLAAVPAGCSDPGQVRTYTVARPDKPAQVDYRILGAMFPADEPVWFFKLTGPAAAVAEHEAAVDALLKTVKLPAGDGTPAYDLPAGWRSAGPNPAKMRVDTLLLGPADKPLELTVTSARGGAQGNVERWAGQVGASAADWKAYTADIATAAGVKGLRVDVRGPTNPAASGPMMTGGR